MNADLNSAREAATAGTEPRQDALPSYYVARVLDFRLAFLTHDARWTYDIRQAELNLFSSAMTRARELKPALVLLSTPYENLACLLDRAWDAWFESQDQKLASHRRNLQLILKDWEREVRQSRG